MNIFPNTLKVQCDQHDVALFNAGWPCSPLSTARSYWFEFDADGNLIDTDVPEHSDGEAASVLASLAHDFLNANSSTVMPIHIKAIDWALAQGYVICVGDYSETDWDISFSSDRAAIIAAVEATELPNVTIYNKRRSGKHHRIAVFSVIDEGWPSQTINDYVAKPFGEFEHWFDAAMQSYDD